MTDKKPLIFGAIAVVVVLIIVFAGRGGGPEGTPEVKGPTEEVPSAGGTPTSGGGTGGAALPAPKPGTGTTGKGIVILSPIAGMQWVLGANHDITWSREAGITGAISLLNAQTRTVAGWIHSSLDPHQTSYTWNTKEVFLARGSPTKKDLAPGNYVIRIAFDGPVAGAETGAFTILPQSQATTPLYTITIANATFSPNALTAKKGERVRFTNNDAVSYNVNVAGVVTITVPANSFATLDTSILAPSPYTLYADGYPQLRGTLTIK